VVLAVAGALEVAIVLAVYWVDSSLQPLDPVGAGVVFVAIVAAGLSGAGVGLGTALVGVIASFVLLADFGTVIGALNAVGSAILWCGAATGTGLAIQRLRRQILRRQAALGQALDRSLSARRQIERVLDFSPQFHQGGDTTEVGATLCETAIETFGCDGVRLYDVKDGMLELVALCPPSDLFQSGVAFPLSGYPDLADALRERRPSFIRDARLTALSGPALELRQEMGMVSTIRIPIANPSGAVGLLSLNWRHVIDRPTEELLAIMQRFADQAGIARQNALRVEAQRQAETLREALDRVLKVAPSFHITGTREEVANAICQAALGSFDCTAAALYSIEIDRLRLLGRVPPVKPLSRGVTFPLTGEMPLARDLGSHAPTFISDVTDARYSLQPWPPEVVRESGTRSALYVPLRFEERGPGNLLVLAWDTPREEPGEEMLAVVQRFADQVALALTNASAQRLHARLEASLLPTNPTEHPRLSLTTRYRTGEQRLRLGGDFIGSLTASDGVLHFVLGDVSGHGPDAAALGATLRSTWKALVLAEQSVNDTMAVMDEVLLAERTEPNAFATIVIGRIDLEDGGLFLANAGHHPPLLVHDRVTPLETTPSPPLGFADGRTISVARFALPAAEWSLLCYTDGLIDARVSAETSERLGEEGLIESLESWTGRRPDGSTLDRLLAGIEARNGGPFADDVALLLVTTKVC